MYVQVHLKYISWGQMSLRCPRKNLSINKHVARPKPWSEEIDVDLSIIYIIIYSRFGT